jgi:bifunctional DNA primase/polymerase-like protein
MESTTVIAATTHPNYNAASTGLPDGVVHPGGNRTGTADYVAIATEALNRGFRITPVHPMEKRGVLYNWNRQPTTTLSEVLQQAKDFPNHNVGIVGRNGIGNHCFLDIDAEGVFERIEETGQKMPVTYTVCSRPQTAPWKKHFYFKQTSYSVSRLRKEANRKDTTKWVTSANTDAPHNVRPKGYRWRWPGCCGRVCS